MEREKAIKKIDDIIWVLSKEIPEEIEVDGKIYRPRDDMEGDREAAYIKYLKLYRSVRERIDEMEDVPEELVEKAILLRRIVLFFKEFRHEDEIDEKKRWIDYAKRLE
jgi:hypothetical protein